MTSGYDNIQDALDRQKNNKTVDKSKARWIPKVEDTPRVNKSQRGLLNYSKTKLNKLVIREFRDGVGRFGYEVDTHLVTAKKETYGWIVSFHKTLVELAMEKNKKILLYLASNDAFYEFNPATVKRKGTINIRGHEEMINIDIRSGKRHNP